MAETAVSLVIQNLAPLLITEAKLLKGIHKEVTRIRREMEMIQSFLKDADIKAESNDRSNVAKTLVKHVREEAYHIEDVIDEYILHFANQSHRQKPSFYFLQKVFHFTRNLKARHVIASKIQGINRILKDIQTSGERFSSSAIGQERSSIEAKSDKWNDPRMASLVIEEDEVVGIESHRDELINWLIEGPSNRMVFSVIGIGGLGKTTLVKKVYDNIKLVPHFGCRAWITVSLSYKIEELLRDMIKQFYKAREEFAPKEFDTMKVTSLIEESKNYLREQRYVVIFDDVWDIEFWECIKWSFPENDKGSRIIITTRNKDVAPSKNESLDLPCLPFENAFKLFCKKVFKHEGGRCPEEFFDISREIVEKCGGLPLAILAIGGLFINKAKEVSEWHKVLRSLSSEFEINSPHLGSLRRILSFSYHDLPYNLKACFLYFGMFPEDCAINCARLTRLWIAEGFVREKKGMTLEDVAQDYLNQLIHRSLVQVGEEDFTRRIRICRVHDMMHEVILSRSEELSFNLVSISNYSDFDGVARRLSIQNNVNTQLSRMTNFQTRSILLFGVNEVPNTFLSICFAKFKLMKIMDCQGAPIDYIPKEVGNLFHLRYLSLRDTKVKKLPKTIGKLHNLETLDLKRSFVSELPAEISGLRKLRYVVAYIENADNNFGINFRQAVKIHSGIGCLQALQKLIKIEASSADLIAELGSLVLLRKLEIFKLKRENGMVLCTVLQEMSHLQSLDICASSEDEVLELQSMSSPPPFLRKLRFSGRLDKLPEWIPKLKSITRLSLIWSRLMDDPLKLLQAMPILVELWLYDGYIGEQLSIERGGFQKLKNLGLRSLRGLNRLMIDEGALPLLDQLDIGPCPDSFLVTGIHHLKSLKIVNFFDMPTKFVGSLQPEGPDFGQVERIPSVTFFYRVRGVYYKSYRLGDSKLLEHLQS